MKKSRKIKEWYSKNLGLATNEYGSLFKWIDADTNRFAYTQWSAFEDATKYFEPSSLVEGSKPLSLW